MSPGDPSSGEDSSEEIVSLAGRLSAFVKNWKSLTSNSTIISWVRGYKIPFHSKVSQTFMPAESQWSPRERREIQSSILTLIDKGAVRKCVDMQGQFISKIFLVPKQSGGFRLVLNLKDLNEFVSTEHFKLEDHKTVIKMVTKDCFMATVDLTDAYYLISIREQDRKFLRFYFEKELYEFCCLPFGLSSAPFVFTKILKPLFSFLRLRGFMSVVYLDDILVLGDSYEECLRNLSETSCWLRFLGFLINDQKSQLTPNKTANYLGFIYNSEDMSVSLPMEKIRKTEDLLNELSKIERCSIRFFARFVGILISICPAIPYGWLYTKRFEREKFLALQKNSGDFDAMMSIPEYLSKDFQWWSKNVSCCKNPIRDFSFKLEIFSDASLSGWGIVANDRSSHGFWTDLDLVHDINYLELRAALFGLKCFAKDLKDCQILLRIDNTTAISYINRMGSIQFLHLSEVAREIWRWCEDRNIWVFASYIRSKENVEADFESRRLKPETEYELSAEAFQTIVTSFGQPDIDLFASRANNKCQDYISWRPDPDSIAIDAFTVCWARYFFYAFPPFSIILRVLQKIRCEKARGILIVPYWPAQPWYPVFKSMLTSDPLYFNPDKNLLFTSNREPHPLWENLTLVAGICSCQV